MEEVRRQAPVRTLTVPVTSSARRRTGRHRGARLRHEPDQRLGPDRSFNFGGLGDVGSETLPVTPSRSSTAVRVPRTTSSASTRVGSASYGRSSASTTPPPTGSTWSTHAELRGRSPRALTDGTNDPSTSSPVALRVATAPWLAQSGSRNVAARRLRLRVALGDDTLSFVGYAIGTAIGLVYAEMFPDRVGWHGSTRRSISQPMHSKSCAGTHRASNGRSTTSSPTAPPTGAVRSAAVAIPPSRSPRSSSGSRAGTQLPDRGPRHRRQVEAQGRRRCSTSPSSPLYDRQFGWPSSPAC